MKRLKVLVDMDNVLAQIMPPWLKKYSEWIPDDVVTVDQITDYDMTKFVKYPMAFLGILDQQNFFYNLEPLPGAVEYFAKLSEIADVKIATQPPLSDYGIVDKKRWVKKYWPNFDLTKMWFGYDKYELRADVIFDDSPKHLMTWKENNPDGITMTLDYVFTRSVKVDYRFELDTAWEDFYKTIKELSK